MLIKRQRWVLVIGYDIGSDLPMGFALALGCPYRLMIRCHFDWPKIEWREDTWMVNEAGQLAGFPVRRRGIPASSWTGRPYSIRRIFWPRLFHWEWRNGALGD